MVVCIASNLTSSCVMAYTSLMDIAIDFAEKYDELLLPCSLVILFLMSGMQYSLVFEYVTVEFGFLSCWHLEKLQCCLCRFYC